MSTGDTINQPLETLLQPRPPPAPQPCADEALFRIDRDGAWWYRGSVIGRQRLVKLFATVLRREEDGTFWLVTPVERVRVEVEDTPFVAVEMSVEGSGRNRRLRFRTNIDDSVVAGPDHPIRLRPQARGAPAPHVVVRSGLEARIARAVYYDLAELAEERIENGAPTLGVWSDGAFFGLDSVGGRGR